MKTVFSLLSFLFLFVTTNTVAQTISGNVVCEQNEPVEFANIALFSLPDSTLITGAVTNENGGFTLYANGSADNAFLQISFIGYETQNVSAAQNQIITLKTDALLLGDVVVQGNLPQIRLRNDAIVTTVENSVLARAGTGNDVLKRLPALTGDDGSFSVFGKGGAIIYINNRLMRDPSELDNLNSSDIREVEIITNPGARYDASVKAVIRIITIRKVGDGFSFDARSTFLQPKHSGGMTQQLNMNYRQNGWDFFGTIFYNEGRGFQDSETQQKVYADQLWTQEMKTRFDNYWNRLRGVAGVNYEFSPKHSIGARYTLTTTPNNYGKGFLDSYVMSNGEFYDTLHTKINERRVVQPEHRFNTYYNGEFGDLKVDFNADYFANEHQINTITTETSQEFDDRTVTANNALSNQLIATKLIVSYPVLGGQFSLGNEFSNTNRKDNYQNKEGIVASSNTTIHEQSNSFFAEYSRAFSFGQVGAGLRYENVRFDYFTKDVRSNDQSRHYHQWFPNVSFATQWESVGLQLSYTAKTQRPGYWQLRNNVTYANRFTMQTGNPYLIPTTVHDISLVSTWKFMNLMLSYKDERNAIIFWAEQMEENPAITLLSHRNWDRIPSFTAFLSAAPKFGIWSPQASAGIVKQWLTFPVNNEPMAMNKPMFMASLNHSFSLPKGFLFTLDTRFQGKGHGQNWYIYKNSFVVGAGISKSFFDKQLQIDLKGHDIFSGWKDAHQIHIGQWELQQLDRRDRQKVELTARYRFNSARSKYRGTGAGESQINRL